MFDVPSQLGSVNAVKVKSSMSQFGSIPRIGGVSLPRDKRGLFDVGRARAVTTRGAIVRDRFMVVRCRRTLA